MGDVTGFIKYNREDFHKESVVERLKHWKEFYKPMPEGDLKNQGARCMDCGIPFCQEGCPIGNIIPDWNDLVFRDRWQEAIERTRKGGSNPNRLKSGQGKPSRSLAPVPRDWPARIN